MSAYLFNSALIDDDDLVSLLHSGQSVGDQNHTFAVEILVDGLLYEVL